MQALGLDIKILTEGNKEISLNELSQDEVDAPNTLAQDTEKDLEEGIYDFDAQPSDDNKLTAEEQEDKDFKDVFEESTKNSELDNLDIFDDFGDFDD